MLIGKLTPLFKMTANDTLKCKWFDVKMCLIHDV